MRHLVFALSVIGMTFLTTSYTKANPVSKPAKVLVAHLAEVVEELDEITEEVISTTYYYNVIEVSEKALSGHSGHGDVIDGEELPDGTIWNETDYSKGDKFEIVVDSVPE